MRVSGLGKTPKIASLHQMVLEFCAEMKKSHNLEYPQENKHERSEVFVSIGYDNDKIRECEERRLQRRGFCR